MERDSGKSAKTGQFLEGLVAAVKSNCRCTLKYPACAIVLFTTIHLCYVMFYTQPRVIASPVPALNMTLPRVLNRAFPAKTRSKVPNFDGRETKLRRLGDLIQRRLFYIQNPKNCSAAKKVLCKFSKRAIGYGSQMHDWMACLIVAYATERTLIMNSTGWQYAPGGLEALFLPLSTNCTSTENQKVVRTRDLRNITDIPVVELLRNHQILPRPKYFPYAIPEDIADDIMNVHSNPAVWWIGQFLVFLTRPNQRLQNFIGRNIKASSFRHPIVGVHVRRTDKRMETKYHTLAEYMVHVTAWFERFHGAVRRLVYLASDDTNVILHARKRYPNYIFVNNLYASREAGNLSTRYSESSLRGLILDIHMLSTCDFAVCTFSSNVCRLVYMLMSVRHPDSPNRIRSVDFDYSFSDVFVKKNFLERIRNTSQRNGPTILKDSNRDQNNAIVSVDNRRSRVRMPTYPEVRRP